MTHRTTKKNDFFETHILQILKVLFSTTVNSCERVLIVFLVLSNKHCKVKRPLNGPEGDWQFPGSSPPNQQLLHQRQEAKALAKEVWRKLSTNAARCLQTLPLSTELEGSWSWKWTDWNWSDWSCAYVSKKKHLHRVHLLIYMALATCNFGNSVRSSSFYERHPATNGVDRSFGQEVLGCQENILTFYITGRQ